MPNIWHKLYQFQKDREGKKKERKVSSSFMTWPVNQTPYALSDTQRNSVYIYWTVRLGIFHSLKSIHQGLFLLPYRWLNLVETKSGVSVLKSGRSTLSIQLKFV